MCRAELLIEKTDTDCWNGLTENNTGAPRRIYKKTRATVVNRIHKDRELACKADTPTCVQLVRSLARQSQTPQLSMLSMKYCKEEVKRTLRVAAAEKAW